MSSTNEERKKMQKEQKTRENTRKVNFWNGLTQLERSSWVEASIARHVVARREGMFKWNITQAVDMAYEAHRLFVDPDTGNIVIKHSRL